jgi:hypothetical protein
MVATAILGSRHVTSCGGQLINEFSLVHCPIFVKLLNGAFYKILQSVALVNVTIQMRFTSAHLYFAKKPYISEATTCCGRLIITCSISNYHYNNKYN